MVMFMGPINLPRLSRWGLVNLFKFRDFVFVFFASKYLNVVVRNITTAGSKPRKPQRSNIEFRAGRTQNARPQGGGYCSLATSISILILLHLLIQCYVIFFSFLFFRPSKQTLRRLAQNREAARKSRLRKKVRPRIK